MAPSAGSLKAQPSLKESEAEAMGKREELGLDVLTVLREADEAARAAIGKRGWKAQQAARRAQKAFRERRWQRVCAIFRERIERAYRGSEEPFRFEGQSEGPSQSEGESEGLDELQRGQSEADCLNPVSLCLKTVVDDAVRQEATVAGQEPAQSPAQQAAGAEPGAARVLVPAGQEGAPWPGRRLDWIADEGAAGEPPAPAEGQDQ